MHSNILNFKFYPNTLLALFISNHIPHLTFTFFLYSSFSTIPLLLSNLKIGNSIIINIIFKQVLLKIVLFNSFLNI